MNFDLPYPPAFGPDCAEYNRYIDLYVDESSQTGHRYLLFGALMVRTRRVGVIEAAIANARLPELPPEIEMKWNKVSESKLKAYKRSVDVFWDKTLLATAREDKPLDYHCLFFDTTRTDDETYNDGDRELGFNKELYQAILRCAQRQRSSFLHVYIDDRGKGVDAAYQLKIILNNSLAKKGDARPSPIRHLEFIDSKASNCLQLADVFTGAIAYELNGHKDKEGAPGCKVALSHYIVRQRNRFGIIGNIIDGTGPGDFGRWIIKPCRR